MKKGFIYSYVYATNAREAKTDCTQPVRQEEIKLMPRSRKQIVR